jgi:hypothetical protein
MGQVLQFRLRASEPTKEKIEEKAEELLAKRAAKKSERFMRSVEAAKQKFLWNNDEKNPA